MWITCGPMRINLGNCDFYFTHPRGVFLTFNKHQILVTQHATLWDKLVNRWGKRSLITSLDPYDYAKFLDAISKVRKVNFKRCEVELKDK